MIMCFVFRTNRSNTLMSRRVAAESSSGDVSVGSCSGAVRVARSNQQIQGQHHAPGLCDE